MTTREQFVYSDCLQDVNVFISALCHKDVQGSGRAGLHKHELSAS